MLDIRDGDVGGGRVRRTFTRGDRRLVAGEYLTADEVLSIPVANRRALVDSNFLELYPKSAAPPQAMTPMDRFVVGVGKDKFNVIEGRLLTDTPLSKSEAEQLANASN